MSESPRLPRCGLTLAERDGHTYMCDKPDGHKRNHRAQQWWDDLGRNERLWVQIEWAEPFALDSDRSLEVPHKQGGVS